MTGCNPGSSNPGTPCKTQAPAQKSGGMPPVFPCRSLPGEHENPGGVGEQTEDETHRVGACRGIGGFGFALLLPFEHHPCRKTPGDSDDTSTPCREATGSHPSCPTVSQTFPGDDHGVMEGVHPLAGAGVPVRQAPLRRKGGGSFHLRGQKLRCACKEWDGVGVRRPGSRGRCGEARRARCAGIQCAELPPTAPAAPSAPGDPTQRPGWRQRCCASIAGNFCRFGNLNPHLVSGFTRPTRLWGFEPLGFLRCQG